MVGFLCAAISAFVRGGGGIGGGGREGDERKVDKPAVPELGPHVLEICISHVLDAEDEAVLVLVGALADRAEQLDRVLFALFLRLGEVHDFGALGPRHGG